MPKITPEIIEEWAKISALGYDATSRKTSIPKYQKFVAKLKEQAIDPVEVLSAEIPLIKQTAIESAVECNNPTLLKLLINDGVNPYAKNKEGVDIYQIFTKQLGKDIPKKDAKELLQELFTVAVSEYGPENFLDKFTDQKGVNISSKLSKGEIKEYTESAVRRSKAKLNKSGGHSRQGGFAAAESKRRETSSDEELEL